MVSFIYNKNILVFKQEQKWRINSDFKEKVIGFYLHQLDFINKSCISENPLYSSLMAIFAHQFS